MNDQLPAGRRKAKAKRNKGNKERGVVMHMLLRSPKDTLAVALALTAVLAIAINAMFLQAGRHPSPLFGTTVPLPKPVSVAPAPQQVVVAPSASAVPAPVVAAPASVPSSPMPRPRPAEAEIKPGDPLGNLVRATSGPMTQSTNVMRPPAAIPAAAAPARGDPLANMIVSSQRVAAVQRALTDYGYGQIKATGTVGADTQAAIQKFEREHKMQITGQMSERLVKELALATGRSFD
jgi:hypothetical protein